MRVKYGFVAQSCEGRFSPYPRRTFPTGAVIGMPSAVYRLRTTMRIWISATCLPKSRAMSDWPISFRQCILVSTRLRRWYPLKRRHKVRPKYRCALTASFRAIAPALVGFQGLAFLRGGITAWAFLAAMVSWHLCVSYALTTDILVLTAVSY